MLSLPSASYTTNEKLEDGWFWGTSLEWPALVSDFLLSFLFIKQGNDMGFGVFTIMGVHESVHTDSRALIVT